MISFGGAPHSFIFATNSTTSSVLASERSFSEGDCCSKGLSAPGSSNFETIEETIDC